MEEFGGGLFVGVIVAVFAGMISYAAAQSTVRDQAIAAGVGCYQAKTNGASDFRWNCKQP